MIFTKIEVENYGVFRGKQIFDLRTVKSTNFKRPIILFGGKNGSGKQICRKQILQPAITLQRLVQQIQQHKPRPNKNQCSNTLQATNRSARFCEGLTV